MKNIPKINYQITEKELTGNDYVNIFKLLDKLTLNGEKSYGCLYLSFYNNESKKAPIYLDKTKCNFIKAVYKKYSHLFYFIAEDPSKMELFYCIVDVKLKNSLVVPQYNLKMSKLIDKINNDVRHYGVEVNDEVGASESIKFLELLKKRHVKKRQSNAQLM